MNDSPPQGNANEKRRIPTCSGWFTLWLEFEHYVLNDLYDEDFNAIIHVHDGRKCALNVWTYRAISRLVDNERAMQMSLSGKYLMPPDLFVEKAERGLMEEVVKDLLEQGILEEQLDREQVGFPVVFHMSPTLSPDEQDGLIVRFQEEVMERHRLQFSGVKLPNGTWDGFIAPTAESKDATEDDRQAVADWFISTSDVLEHKVGSMSTDWGEES